MKDSDSKIPSNLVVGKEAVLKSNEGGTKETASLTELFSTADAADCFYMAMGTLGAIITGACMPFMCVLFGRMLDALNSNPDRFKKTVAELCVVFLGLSALNVISGTMQVAGWTIAGERQTQRFRERYVKSIMKQDIGWFDLNAAGELSTQVSDVCGKIQDGITRKLSGLIQYGSQIIFSFVAAFILCWKLTLVIMTSVPLIGVCGAFMIAAVTAAQNETMGQYAAAGGLATEVLGAIRTVTALNAQPEAISRYRKFIIQAMKIGITKGIKVGLGTGGTFCASYLSYALGFWYGAKLIADQIVHGCPSTGCITGGTVVAVFFCVLIGSSSIGQITPPLSAFFAAKAAVVPILKVLRREPEIDGLTDEGTKPLRRSNGHIQLKDVTFAYPSRPHIEVCRNYNLTIEPGELVALVGSSGSGKSTIMSLLLRFYDPREGQVLLDGTDIKTLNVRWLRSQIGYVGQEPVLFAGSIAQNILYGLDLGVAVGSTKELAKDDDDASMSPQLMERVKAAAKLANAHDFISNFPSNYETDVGPGGASLSGGQKQRIAIARALIRRPSVLLLDEATSALDSASERLVQESIDQLQQSKKQTTLVIAHRLSTIQFADKIAVVNKGSVAELGTHAELLALNGIYADLVRIQLSSSDEESESTKTKIDVEEFKTDIKVASKDTSVVVTTAKVLNEEGTPSSKEVEKQQMSAAERKLFRQRAWALVMKEPFWLAFGLLGSGVVGAIYPIWGYLLAHAEDMFYLEDDERLRKRSVIISTYFCILAGAAFLSSLAQQASTAKVGQRVSLILRSELFEALMRREIGFFDNPDNSVGALTTRLSEDARLVSEATGDVVASQIQALFTMAVGIGIGFSASWKISFVVLATFPLNVLGGIIQAKVRTGQLGDKEGLGGGGHGGIISTAFTHMRTVSALSMQRAVCDLYASLTNQIAVEREKRSYIAGLAMGAANGVMFCTYALLFWYGSNLISEGELTFVDMMTAMLVLMLGALGLGQAVNDVADTHEGLEATRRIYSVVDESKKGPIDNLSLEGIVPQSHSKGRIELKDVYFSYPTRPDTDVCSNYNLTIEPGELVALVGASGSGKSTIMNLLLRFYEPREGQVLLDGTDIRTLNVRWLRSQIGYVGQEPVLFSGTVAENIAKGRADAQARHGMTLDEAVAAQNAGDASCGVSCLRQAPHTDSPSDEETGLRTGEVPEDIIEAARASNAHDFITHFTNGYFTDVGEGSVMVSGGQKQRIAIARALIRRPSVLLLDEATSALDSASERLVQESIDQLQQSKAQTTVVIAHRLSTIRNADKIAVVEAGRIVELGNHDELVMKNGKYAALLAKQKGGVVSNSSTDALELLTSEDRT